MQTRSVKIGPQPNDRGIAPDRLLPSIRRELSRPMRVPMKKFQLWLMCAVGLASGPWSARSETDDPPAVLGTLTPDQQALLPLMDPEFAADCVALVQKAKTWKSRFTRIEAQARQISDDPRRPALSASQDDLAALVSDINTELQKCCTALRQHLKITEKIKSRLQEAEGQWRNCHLRPGGVFRRRRGRVPPRGKATRYRRGRS